MFSCTIAFAKKELLPKDSYTMRLFAGSLITVSRALRSGFMIYVFREVVLAGET